MKPVTTIHISENKMPDAIKIINALAKLEDRKPHDAARRLILEEGKAKVEKLQSELKRSSMTN